MSLFVRQFHFIQGSQKKGVTGTHPLKPFLNFFREAFQQAPLAQATVPPPRDVYCHVHGLRKKEPPSWTDGATLDCPGRD